MRSLSMFVLAMCVTAAYAHHAFNAEFDAAKPITLEGTITAVEWGVPHTRVYVSVPDSTGKVKEWQVEGDAPHILQQLGWKKEMLFEMVKAKTKVKLTGYLSIRSVPNDLFRYAWIENITLPDGRLLPFHRPNARG